MGDAQGNPYLANLGDRAGAMRSYQKAFALHSALAAGSPSDVTLRRDVAADHGKIADMRWADAKYGDALTGYRAANAIYERLAAENPASLEDRFNVSRSLNRMGQLQMNAGELARRVGSLPPIVGVDSRIEGRRSGQRSLPSGSRGCGPEDRRRRGSVARLPDQLRWLCAG